MPVSPYLFFNGDCRQAVEFYADVFGTERPEIMRFGDAPAEPGMEPPEEMRDLIMYASLTIHGTTVMLSDAMPNSPVEKGKNIGLVVVTSDLEKLQAEFAKLGESGKVYMDLGETFWSPVYGVVTDKFGVDWQFSYEAEEAGS